MELWTIGLFCAAILICVSLDLPILLALSIGLVLFLLYGRKKGVSWQELIKVALSGVLTVKNILITFLLIGVMTALWRAAGTIAVIVCYATEFVRPEIFLVMAFLLNCLVSVLTGTAFGTAATMGVICATMAATMGVSPVYVGGVVLAGSYFGDRCSPVSTSALLVADLTKTSIYENIKKMIKTGAVPFLITCVIYLVIGFLTTKGGVMPDLWDLFEREFNLTWIALIPALVILVLSLCRVNVKAAMTVSIVTAVPICLFAQGIPFGEVPGIMLTGFQAADAEVATMINGGGMLSMLNVSGVVCLSASYAGIFRLTGLLDPAKAWIGKVAEHTTVYTATLITAITAVMIACNQTLSIMLSRQLCEELYEKVEDMAIDLADTAVIVAPMIPWAIANAVPLATVGAPVSSALFACFLYVLPLWRVWRSFRKDLS